MDSVTHLAFGAALGIATMGRRTAPWKAALWGAIGNTLPDLDVFLRHGDPVSDMTMHRGDSHALFWLTLAAPLVAALPAWLHREAGYARWWLLAWLSLVTHPLLDVLTVYGTQLLRPFDDAAYGLGSIFIVDLLLTVPLLLGLAAGWRGRLRGNAIGLAVGLAYLGWGLAVQQHVAGIARASLAAQGIAVQRLLVTPTPFNSIAWRVVAVGEREFHEGFYSLLDATPAMAFDAFPLGREWLAPLADHPPVQRMAWFTHGLYKLQREGDRLLLSDLRMGQEPAYTFVFAVGEVVDGQVRPVPPEGGFGTRGDLGAGLRWLGRRIAGDPTPPPR